MKNKHIEIIFIKNIPIIKINSKLLSLSIFIIIIASVIFLVFDIFRIQNENIVPWEDGIIHYNISNRIPSNIAQTIRDAMNVWESVCNVQFINNPDGEYRIDTWDKQIAASSTGSSKIQNIELGMKIGNVPRAYINFAILHELGHCLGLLHEHSRKDRDKYITILWENISNDCKKDFKIKKSPLISEDDFEYDYNSIMHYSSHICSDNGKITIDSHGQDIENITISKSDIMKVQTIYGGAIKKDAKGACFDGFRCISGIYRFQCFGENAQFFKDKTCVDFDNEYSFKRKEISKIGIFE